MHVRDHRRFVHQHVCGQGRRARSQRPHVQVVDVQHAGLSTHRGAHLLQVDALGHAFQQHVDRLAQQHPGARQHPQADQQRQHRVEPVPAGGADQQRADDHRHRTEHVAPHFQIGALHVQALAAAGLQQAHGDEVDQQAGRRDGEHAAGRDRVRGAEAFHRLPQDVGADGEQQRAVDQRAQRLQPRVAVGTARVRRPARQPHREQRDHQAEHVGGHVRGIGQQRQAARGERAGHFDQQEAGGQAQRPPQRALMADLAGRVVVVAHGGSWKTGAG